MWADNETGIDLLGFTVHKDLIRRLVTDDRLLPVTIGVFGDWGGGKSSVMRILQEDLEDGESEGIACLYFNGWMFEGYDDAKAALISSILMQLGEHKRVGPKIRDRVVTLLKRVDRMRLLGLALKRGIAPLSGLALGAGAAAGLIDPQMAAAIGSALPAASAALNALPGGERSSEETGEEDTEDIDWSRLLKEDKSEASPLDIRSFRRDFEQLLAATGLRALVVLIDDLDRCEPGRLIENLEAIKLFLAVPKTAFVIGADERIVRHAIAARYAAPRMGDEQPARNEPYDLVTDYLEKLIQVPYHLPRLSPSEIESYITLLFCQLELEDEQFAKVRTHCEAARKDNLYVTYGAGSVGDALGEALPATLAERLQWTSSVSPTMTEGLKGNPRQVKRFLNALLLRKQLADVAGLDIQDDILVKLMLLEYSRDTLFDKLYEWQAVVEGPLPQLAHLERAARGATAPATEPAEQKTATAEAYPAWQERGAQDWLRLEPSLADVDLRDYFWIARDKLRSTLSGLTMVPPVVRALLQGLVSADDVERELTAREAARLNAEERAALLRLLGQHLQRKPDEPGGLAGLVSLVEGGVDGALDTMVSTLGALSPTSIPPNAAYDLQTIVATRPDSGQAVLPLLRRWATTQTGVGKAAEDALKDLDRPTM